jgi:hypothetical protein
MLLVSIGMVFVVDFLGIVLRPPLLFLLQYVLLAAASKQAGLVCSRRQKPFVAPCFFSKITCLTTVPFFAIPFIANNSLWPCREVDYYKHKWLETLA